jgi:hypothetical protein
VPMRTWLRALGTHADVAACFVPSERCSVRSRSPHMNITSPRPPSWRCAEVATHEHHITLGRHRGDVRAMPWTPLRVHQSSTVGCCRVTPTPAPPLAHPVDVSWQCTAVWTCRHRDWGGTATALIAATTHLSVFCAGDFESQHGDITVLVSGCAVRPVPVCWCRLLPRMEI